MLGHFFSLGDHAQVPIPAKTTTCMEIFYFGHVPKVTSEANHLRLCSCEPQLRPDPLGKDLSSACFTILWNKLIHSMPECLSVCPSSPPGMFRVTFCYTFLGTDNPVADPVPRSVEWCAGCIVPEWTRVKGEGVATASSDTTSLTPTLKGRVTVPT